VEPLPLWEAAKLEMEEYQFVASAGLQPKWSVPREIAINVAISGRFSDAVDQPSGHPVSIEDYADAASKVIEAGACGIHVDFSFVTDPKGPAARPRHPIRRGLRNGARAAAQALRYLVR